MCVNKVRGQREPLHQGAQPFWHVPAYLNLQTLPECLPSSSCHPNALLSFSTWRGPGVGELKVNQGGDRLRKAGWAQPVGGLLAMLRIWTLF